MTTADLLVALSQKCPNGVSFDPMAVRLLRKKVPFEDWQVGKLKAEMFQLENRLWYSCEMVSDDETCSAIYEKATAWLESYDCFSVEQLFKSFNNELRHIKTPGDFAIFLRHLGFTVATRGKEGLFCFNSPPTLAECLVTASKQISKRLENAHGTLPFREIVAAMPHLSPEALKSLLAHNLPEVHAADVGGVPCWCSSEAIPLPEDFSEQVTTAVDTLIELGEKVSAAKLEFALNLFYRTRLREEYSLRDNETFMNVCGNYYQGENDFPKTRNTQNKNKKKASTGKRTRRPNTRFQNLNVPVGAKLTFVNDKHITCRVLDEVNQVEYDGEPWALSTLAVHLMDGVTVNGFSYFSYEGEVLWDRRLRLEQER